MDVPDDVCLELERTVTERLVGELGARGLLLTAERFREGGAVAERDGRRLLTSTIHRFYPLSEFDTQVLTLEFDSEHAAARVRAALAFGAVTARLLLPPGVPAAQREPRELASAIFNLGVGLVDGVCDEDADVGLRLLDVIDVSDVAAAARVARVRGWLRASLPVELEADPTASFTVDVVEAFFATLHATFPGEAWAELRRRVGDQLAAALRAERGSLTAASAGAPIEQLAGFSHATSVLPFEIVGTLAGDDRAAGAARHLGEAMWRIDDLVDLCDDARSGALNAVLLTASGSAAPALERLLASNVVAAEAAKAAEHLRRGVDAAAGRDADGSREGFLHFVARYAGVDAPMS